MDVVCVIVFITVNEKVNINYKFKIGPSKFFLHITHLMNKEK